MRPFVVRLEPTPFDPASASSATGKDDQASLKHTWNAWNAKARGLIEQGSRIENLYWRRWHMDQRQGAVYHASPPLPQANFPNDLSASVEAVERRRATEDLEAFLRNTLQAAQPTTQAQVAHNPPTYDAFLPPASSAPQQPPAPPSIPPPAQNTFQPPVIHAPQPQRAPYNLSPEWGYTNLPASSLPPPSSSANLSRIIATPSWTALISDPAAAAAVAQLQHQQHQHSAHQQHMQQQMHYPGALGFPPPFGYPPLQPHLAPPMDPFAAAFPYGLPTQQQPPHSMSMMPPPIPSPSFTLPPTATLFSDLGTALSSAPSAAAPPAFFSSYGMYQPVVAPYPRFLTPSPEPSVLGELELELGPSTGEFDAAAAAAVAAAGGVAGTATNGQSSGDPDGMDSVWKDFENGHEIGANGVGGAAGAAGGGGSGSKTDPFEGMSLAQMRSRANSLEAIDREAARFQAYGVNEAGGGTLAEQAAREVEMAALAASGHVPPAKGAGAVKGKRKAENGGGGGKKAKAAAAAAATSTSSTPAGSPPLAAGAVGAASALLPPGSEPLDADGKPLGKKNRNPHSTQLPGNGQRRLPKEEAGEGHDGPICSHCASITTPLWRRGPEDELLCNACGLYLKLHGKPRPKTFGKNNGSKRSSNGAAAQAAASGVPPSCNNCGATSTPMWRKDPEGKLCCNACSLYYKLHKVARPASLAQKRKAAAAAKANLAAAAAATTDANAEASTSAQKLPGSSGTTTPTTATGDTTMSAPPLSQLQSHALPHYPQTFQLPPVLPPPQPHPSLLGSDGQPQSHLQLPPGWPLGGMPGYPPYPPPPPQQQQQQQQNGAAPPPQAPPPMPHPHLQHHYQQQHLFQQQQQQLLQQQQQHLQQQHAQNLQQQQQQQQQKHQQKFTLPPAIPAPLPPSPFAQTAWGALAYGIVSAAAAEEAGGVQGSQTPQPHPPPQQQQQQQQQQNPPTFPGAPPPA